MLRQGEFNHLEYYRYLNCGYRLPLVGGTDKMSNDVPIGLYRTYARVGDGRSSPTPPGATRSNADARS